MNWIMRQFACLPDEEKRIVQNQVLGIQQALRERIGCWVTMMLGAHLWTEDSPVRFEIMEEGMKHGKNGPGGFRGIRIMAPTMLGIVKSLRTLKNDPSQPKTKAPAELPDDLEAYLFDLGVNSVGYTWVL